MLRLTTEDTFVIRGRGTVHTLHMPKGHNPRDLKGQEVVLDGQRVKVTAVCTPAVCDGASILTNGCPTGLMVEWRETGFAGFRARASASG